MGTQLNITYKQIFTIALPLILGSAGQNIVALTDSLFMLYLSKEDFATIGIVGIFYLLIAAIGYGFSKGGQVLIARKMGEGKPQEVGRMFFDMLYLELALALLMFLFMRWVCPYAFRFFIHSEEIYTRSLAFLDTRAWGVFFSYSGLALVSLYTGVARTRIILATTGILFFANILFCFAFIYGKFGAPQLGIRGAGLASTLAEAVALLIFVTYLIFDKESRKYNLFSPRKIDIGIIKQQMAISLPSVAQPFVGLGSWFLFFSVVEKHLGKDALAITNLVRNVYLLLSIPSWGFASSVNTLVANVIGQGRYESVFPAILKTAKLCLAVTMFFALPMLLFPHTFIEPIFRSTGEAEMLTESVPILRVLIGILAIFSIGAVFFNALASMGAASFGLLLQLVCAVFYLVLIHYILIYTNGGLAWAWAAEGFYWVLMLIITIYYLRSDRWLKRVM